MEAWQAVLLVLVALLVGVLIPAVVQATQALHAVRAAAAAATPALTTITATAGRLERLAGTLEADGRLERALEAIDGLAKTVARFQDTARVATAVGAAVGPAVGAAVRAWRDSRANGAAHPEGAEELSHEGPREEETT
jgi:hypothetical protein